MLVVYAVPMLMLATVSILAILYYSRLVSAAHRQQQIYGVVTSEMIVNHGPSYNYTFTLRGETFSGTGGPDPVRPYAVGEPIRVYFDGENPKQNALAEFSKRAGQSLIVAIAPLLIFAFVALSILYRWWRAYRRRAAQGPVDGPSSFPS